MDVMHGPFPVVQSRRGVMISPVSGIAKVDDERVLSAREEALLIAMEGLFGLGHICYEIKHKTAGDVDRSVIGRRNAAGCGNARGKRGGERQQAKSLQGHCARKKCIPDEARRIFPCCEGETATIQLTGQKPELKSPLAPRMPQCSPLMLRQKDILRPALDGLC